MIRFVVCFDLDTDEVKEAYKQMRIFLQGGNPKGFLGWETSDEWYSSGEEAPGDPGELQEAIIAVMQSDLLQKGKE